VNPGGGVDQDHGNLAFATLRQEFLNAHQILAGSGVLGELGHAFTPVEFLDGSDDCFALRLCLGETNSVCKVAIGNIDSGFHDSILLTSIFPVKVDGNTVNVEHDVSRVHDSQQAAGSATHAKLALTKLKNERYHTIEYLF
jgi:hypothetical protein